MDGSSQDLGFQGGQVLEPGCGSGNFIGFAPPAARMTGVELEPQTAAIAAALYPQRHDHPRLVRRTRLPDSSFDLVIGNVPFGDITLHDPRHNQSGHSIHNHFIVKSLHLTRPGGLVMVLTSRYTMDARNPAARREIAALADLVGALRLPGGAHQRAAGTGVVTDLLILRRREPGRHPDPTAWEQARLTELDGAQIPVNEYFLDHPEAVLGDAGRGRRHLPGRRPHRHRVRGHHHSRSSAGLDRITASAARPRPHLDRDPPTGHAARSKRPASPHPDGYLEARATARSPRSRTAQPDPVRGAAGPRPPSCAPCSRLRDTAVRLLQAEACSPPKTPLIPNGSARPAHPPI